MRRCERNLVLQKNAKNTIDRTGAQYGIVKNMRTYNQKRTVANSKTHQKERFGKKIQFK